ncbi:acyltransferase family protein [Actinomadura gamaensis]|uniref:Acyltransferase family protein n=1 Tax=Actinomadura gamaensis TaxID=1763541 RepID=A0ABV9TWQ0_9ACTN
MNGGTGTGAGSGSGAGSGAGTGAGTGAGSRLRSLTGTRFIAAALVFVFHVTHDDRFITGETGDALKTVFGRSGNVGVAFFFILSGFVLTWSARAGDTPLRFWRRRLVKIFPNHVATYLVAGAALLATGKALTAAVPNLFLVQTWWPDLTAAVSMNDVSWSLSCELLFYLLFPLLLRWVSRIPERLLWASAGVVFAWMTAVPAVAMLFFPDSPKVPYGPLSSVTELQMWFVYFFPPVRALDFVLGMLLARLVLTGRWIGPGVLPAAAITVAAYACTLKAPLLIGVSGAGSAPAGLLIAALAAADRDGRRTPFAGRTWVWLGEISFAFYMVHRLVITYGHRLLGERETWAPLPGLGVVLALAAAALLAAWLLYAAVERPAMRHLAVSRRPAPAPAPIPEPAAPAPAPTPEPAAPASEPLGPEAGPAQVVRAEPQGQQP